MLDAERPHRRAVVHPDLLLLRVEPHALPDQRFRAAGRAPDGEGQLEAHFEDPLPQFAGARAEGVGFVERGGAVRGGVVAAHVEALHFGGWGAGGRWWFRRVVVIGGL